ncbi:hypothetical protein GCM10027442_34370 [Emticicia fontis]
MVKDLDRGGFSSPNNLTGVNGILFFTAYDVDYVHGEELWRSDGTAAGTYMVKDINPGGSSSDITELVNVNGTLYFAARDASNITRLWKSDGTESGTVMVSTDVSSVGFLTHVNGTVYFVGSSSGYGSELWKSDGTSAGTELVKDINPGSGSPFIFYLTNVNGALYFRTAYNSTQSIWKSDGTEQGTVLVKQFNTPYADIGNLTNVNGTLFLTIDDQVHGRELWKSDGTESGTVMVKDINPGAEWANVGNLVVMGNLLYFSAYNNTYGQEMWQSDGTEEGTKLVKDINQSEDLPSYIQLFLNSNGTLYFTIDDGVNGREFWKSDGTSEGTVLVKDINPGSLGSSISNFVNVNGTFYFTANSGSYIPEIWKSDGTAEGTVMVKRIPTGSDYQQIDYMTNVDGKVYFIASTTIDNASYNPTVWSLGTCTPANTFINTNEKTIPFNSQVQGSSNTTCYCNVFNELITTVEATGEAPVSGNIAVREWPYEPVNSYYVPRQYQLYPENNPDDATAKVTFYYTQGDFDVYNAYPISALKLPVDSSDRVGISSILIEKRGGTSFNDSGWPTTYSGSLTEINPEDTDIIWNSAARRWEVSFETTGMGGYILKSMTLTEPTTVSVSNAAICSNETVSLSATCAQGTLNWYTSASGGSSIGTSSPLILSPTVTTTYYAACEYGLNSTNRVATEEVVVTTMPTIPESVMVDNANICSGYSVYLTATCPIGTVVWYNAATGGDYIGTGNNVAPTPTSNTTYYAACENGHCKSERVATSEVIITEQALKPTGVAVDKTAICSGTSINLTGNCAVGTLTWYDQEYDGTTIGTGNNLSLTPEYSYTYYAACENGICISQRIATGYVYVTTQPTIPTNVSMSETAICSGTSVSLSAFCEVGDPIWYTQATGGTSINSDYPFSQTPLSTTTYYVACENGSCVSDRINAGEVVVTTQPTNPTGVAVDKTAICSGTSITLTATCAIGTLTWYNDSIADTSIGTGSGLSLTPTDTYTYYAVCINGDCKSEMVNTDMVTVTTQPTNPINVASYNAAVCSGEPANLSADCAVGEVVWYNSATATTALGTGEYFDPIPASNTTYYVACENGSCKSERIATEEVIVRPTPAKPHDLDQGSTTICTGGAGLFLTGFCTSGTIKWYASATATTAAATGSYTLLFPTENTTYYAACETDFCQSERVAMTPVVVYTTPVNPTGLSVSKTAICIGDSVTLSATCSVGEVKWIRAYTAGGVEQYDLVPTHAPTENSVYYAYCMNGTCFSDYLPTAQVVVSEQPSNPTDLFQGGTQLCDNTGVYLNASCATGTITWYNSATGGTAIGTGEFFIARPTTTTTYYVACENGNCKSARVALNEIVVYQQPVNPTGVSVSKTAICNGETITLSGSCLIGTLHWYKTSMDPDTAFTYKPKVNTVYHATCGNVQCFSESVATAEVVVTQQPTNPTNVSVSSTEICKDEEITLTATCPIGTITWYNSATGTTSIGTGNNFKHSPTVATKYYAACINGICNSGRVVTDEVIVKVKPVAPVIAGRNAICAGEAVILSATALANDPSSTFSWSTGSTNISITESPTTTTNYRAVANFNGCNSDSSAIFTVTVNRVPAQPAITADNATICKGNTVILTGQCPSATDSFYWSNATVTNGDTPVGYYKSTRQITEPGTYKGWCESNTGCKGAEKSITITAGTNCGGKNFITITPAKPIVCPGSSVTLTAAGCTGTVSWLGGVSTLTGTSITISPTVNSTYFVQCSAGGSATVDITVVSSAVVMSTHITTGTEQVKAVNSIESDKKVGNPNFSPAPVVTFEAGKSILLKPGFVADSKSVFTAQIKGCN